MRFFVKAILIATVVILALLAIYYATPYVIEYINETKQTIGSSIKY